MRGLVGGLLLGDDANESFHTFRLIFDKSSWVMHLVMFHRQKDMESRGQATLRDGSSEGHLVSPAQLQDANSKRRPM